jgi:FkbM family methyltransferase
MKAVGETSSRRKPRKFVPWRVALAGVTGLLIALGASQAAPTAVVLYYKATGQGRDCSWAKSASVIHEALKLFDGSAAIKRNMQLLSHDARLDLDKYQAPERSYWIKHSGTASDGRELLAYLISEHRWMDESNPKQGVLPGDIVIDCGAHVGTFTDEALRRGAQTVVAVEPEPVNAECFKRNFHNEIASGKVILIEKGVWSSETTLQISVATANSGMNSFVSDQGSEKLNLPVTTIDKLVQQLGLARVDFIWIGTCGLSEANARDVPPPGRPGGATRYCSTSPSGLQDSVRTVRIRPADQGCDSARVLRSVAAADGAGR